MIKITFTGDVMCEHSRLDQYCENGTYDFTPVFSDVVPVFKKSDYVVANLETPLAGRDLGYSERNYSFNTPDEMAMALKQCGVDLVTTANNHVLDRGIAGLERTLDVLDAAGISHTGSFRVNESAKPFIASIGGIKVAFLSYTYGTEACFNNHYLKKNQFHMVNLTRNQELSNSIKRYFLIHKSLPAKIFRFVYRLVSPGRAKLDVSERKEKDTCQQEHLSEDINYCKEASVDYIIMCLHSGGQFNEEPTEYTKKMVDLCLANGVDAVITNHEHRIQGARFPRNHVVTYCLGNFTSDYGISRKPMGKYAEYSALFHLYLDKKDENVKTRYSVTFLKSNLNEKGLIVTTPVSQLYNACNDEIQREELRKDNLWCLNTFFGVSLIEAPMQDEYDAEEYILR
jgi:poly-gamma-glutamate capsule biosynthesis protein CapA/YwtB (metallophosphatase superfamily)